MGQGPFGGPMWISDTQPTEKLVPMTMTNLVHSRLLEDGWEIPSDHIILEEEIGEGCFGMVHKGIVKGPLPGCVTMKTDYCRKVAIKLLKRTLQCLCLCVYTHSTVEREILAGIKFIDFVQKQHD